MKITLEQDGHKTTIETDSETCDEILQVLCQALMGQGFHPDSVKNAILGKADEYEEEDKDNS